MNQNTPAVDEHEQDKVHRSVNWEDEDEDVIWKGLKKAVNWMEGMGSKRRWDDPFVVWFVNILVDGRYVQPPVYPIDTVVCEQEEEWYTCDKIPPPICIETVVQFAIPHYFCLEPGQDQGEHSGKRFDAADYFLANLVGQKPRVAHHVMVEDEIIGKGREQKVEEVNSNHGDHNQGQQLPWNIVPRPG